jgi:polyphosphate kinase
MPVDLEHQTADDPDSAPASDRALLAPVWIDRDPSWLDFNRRVLAEALDPRTPLLERAKFLAIFTSNLDEFFMKRIAVLRENATPARLRQIAALRERLLPDLDEQARCFRDLVAELAAHGIRLLPWEELSPAQRAEACRYFDAQVSPAVTPLLIDPERPFPFLSNLSLSVGFRLFDPRDGAWNYARIKVPPTLRQWIELHEDARPGERVFVRLHELIRENAGKLYPGMQLSGATLFRLTRDAEVQLDSDHDVDLLQRVRAQLQKRRFEPVVRLELAPGADPSLREGLAERFELREADVYEMPGELDYTSLFQIAGLEVPELRDRPWTPLVPPALRGRPEEIFPLIAAGDVLVHHPYESFDASVERFIRAAASDPATISIKMTVYRVGDDTPFVHSLIRAAEAGKQVACVIELQARFDEERNLHWAAELGKAGAQVVYGVAGLKIHAKTALVVRKEETGLRCYAHIGTGNYNVRTARLYTDFGLLTADLELTREVVSLFHYLTGRSESPCYQKLLVAPSCLRDPLLSKIAAEAQAAREGRHARIVARMNQLEDPAMIRALCDASRAGVPIDLVVRGFCCLRPGVPGWSENIRIRSIIGRFLEHSRIFHFAAGAEDPLEGEFYIGSADWMFRNLSRRVEVVAPVTGRVQRERLWEVLDVNLRDERQAWLLDSAGAYTRVEAHSGDAEAQLGSHDLLLRRTAERVAAAVSAEVQPAGIH